jgi:hypothetical protein
MTIRKRMRSTVLLTVAVSIGLGSVASAKRAEFAIPNSRVHEPVASGTHNPPRLSIASPIPPRAPNPARGPTHHLTRTGVSHLKPVECVALGGQIVGFNPAAAQRLIGQRCDSGKACITTDQNGGAHAACIDEEDD